MAKKIMGLGRGLDALISADDTLTSNNAPSSINEVDIDLIHANPRQPRKDFDQQALERLYILQTGFHHFEFRSVSPIIRAVDQMYPGIVHYLYGPAVIHLFD